MNNRLRPLLTLAALLCLPLLPACDSGGSDGSTDTEYTAMEGPVADCEFDLLTFKLADGTQVEVSINGLTVEELAGSDPVDKTTVAPTRRRGVRFSRILEQGDVTAPDEVPVNCVARDGWDPLRSVLQKDLAKLPSFAFLRDHGYVYVGNPGDKDPLYPEMEGKGLIVDYDLTSDAQVPANVGTTLAALNMHRWKMIEFVDATQRGVIELDPQVEATE